MYVYYSVSASFLALLHFLTTFPLSIFSTELYLISHK